MKTRKLVAEIQAAANKFVAEQSYTGVYYWTLGVHDNNRWAICLGWQDGFEPDESDKYSFEDLHLCVKLAFQPINSMLQCDYDVDWTMPYNEATEEVDDTEEAIYEDTDLEDTVKTLLDLYEFYKEA